MKVESKIIGGGKIITSSEKEGNRQTIENLKYLQSMNLENKIQITQTRIIEWYIHNDKKCYVSFSGGKDSTVLADIVAQVCLLLDCKLIL